MFPLLEFSNPRDFEEVLTGIASNVLSEDHADVSSNQRLAGNAGDLRLDLLFEPRGFTWRRRIYIFEFKFINSYTLSDSLVYTQLARFSALQKANDNIELKFILVTNGIVPHNFHVPQDVFIFPDVKNVKIFEKQLRFWLRDELPGFRQNSYGINSR